MTWLRFLPVGGRSEAPSVSDTVNLLNESPDIFRSGLATHLNRQRLEGQFTASGQYISKSFLLKSMIQWTLYLNISGVPAGERAKLCHQRGPYGSSAANFRFAIRDLRGRS
jgi:hypothetical protein